MQGVRKIIKKALFLHEFAPHRKLGITYYTPSENQFQSLRDSLVENYFSRFTKPFPLDSRSEVEKGFLWMDDHLTLRLEQFRKKYIPFLNSVKSLKNALVLDVGCGTGASLVALAEAGARVIGIDIDQGSLTVAKKRCEIYGQQVETELVQASDIVTFRPELNFDFIIFNASLEHMLLEERVAGLQAAWKRLVPGKGFLGIIECPNRLWYFDSHTSALPFFDWLPNDLAFQYTKFSPREYINMFYTLPPTPENNVNFIRVGRGMSYHELDLAIGNSEELNVLSSLDKYVYTNSNWLNKRRIKKQKDSYFQNFLREKSGKKLHEGFFESWLNLIIQKSVKP